MFKKIIPCKNKEQLMVELTKEVERRETETRDIILNPVNQTELQYVADILDLNVDGLNKLLTTLVKGVNNTINFIINSRDARFETVNQIADYFQHTRDPAIKNFENFNKFITQQLTNENLIEEYLKKAKDLESNAKTLLKESFIPLKCPKDTPSRLKIQDLVQQVQASSNNLVDLKNNVNKLKDFVKAMDKSGEEIDQLVEQIKKLRKSPQDSHFNQNLSALNQKMIDLNKLIANHLLPDSLAVLQVSLGEGKQNEMHPMKQFELNAKLLYENLQKVDFLNSLADDPWKKEYEPLLRKEPLASKTSSLREHSIHRSRESKTPRDADTVTLHHMTLRSRNTSPGRVTVRSPGRGNKGGPK